MKTLPGLLVAAALLLGCNRSIEKPVVMTPEPRVVAGQVFIREASGLTLLVSAVEIKAVEWKDAQKHIEEARALAQKEVAAMQPKVDEARAAWTNSLVEAKAAQEALLAAIRRRGSTDPGRNPSLTLPYTQRAEEAAARAGQLRSDFETLESVQRTYQRFARDGDFAFGKPWPGVISKCVSDANGNFKIKLPADRQAVLVAQFDQQKDGAFNRFMWAVTIAKDESGPVLLTTANLLNGPVENTDRK